MCRQTRQSPRLFSVSLTGACFQLLAEACGAEMTQKLMLPTVLGMATDQVPNVRFNVARTMNVMTPIVDQTCVQQQVPSYQKFSEQLRMHLHVSYFLYYVFM